jgi:hypothetical protein
MLITSIEQVTPEVLTAILRHNGFLWERASVSGLRVVKAGETNAALHYVFEIRYRDPRSLKDAPARAFLKLSRPEYPYPHIFEKEIKFYLDVAPAMQRRYKRDELPLPFCYDAWYDEKNGRSHLLLEDLSEKFMPAKGGQPPSKLHLEKMVEKLAYLHAFWWEHPALEDYATPHTEEALQAAEALYQQKYATFTQVLPNRLSPQQQEMLANIVAHFPPRRRERMVNGTGMTIVHRDTHPGNFMYAYNSVRLIDWQSWRIDSGTDDVAYLLACFLPEQTRRREERHLLQKYYDVLVRLGVKGYTWDDCLYDYRASLARCVAFLLVAWKPEEGAEGWLRGEKALRAFADVEGMAIYRE